MSNDIEVAKRYARALFELAQEKNIVAQVEEELKGVVGAVNANHDFQKFLQHPSIDMAAKLDLLKQAFHGEVSDVVFNTLNLLTERRRESVFNALLTAYLSIANEALGQANATVYAPFPLSDQDAVNVAEKLGMITGKKIKVEHVIDKKLLGGLQVRIGDRLYDGSLAGKLERLRKSLSQTQAL